jgi:hypothetical protein
LRLETSSIAGPVVLSSAIRSVIENPSD